MTTTIIKIETNEDNYNLTHAVISKVLENKFGKDYAKMIKVTTE